MKNIILFSFNFFICVCLLLATERRAFAYVDPGSGLLTLQAAASVMAGCAYYLRRKIAGIFRRSQRDPNATQTVQSAQSKDCDEQKTA